MTDDAFERSPTVREDLRWSLARKLLSLSSRAVPDIYEERIVETLVRQLARRKGMVCIDENEEPITSTTDGIGVALADGSTVEISLVDAICEGEVDEGFVGYVDRDGKHQTLAITESGHV